MLLISNALLIVARHRRRRRGRDSESCLAISHIYKDVCGLAQAKGLPSLIYHEPVLEVRFMRGSGHDEDFDHRRWHGSQKLEK